MALLHEKRRPFGRLFLLSCTSCIRSTVDATVATVLGMFGLALAGFGAPGISPTAPPRRPGRSPPPERGLPLLARAPTPA